VTSSLGHICFILTPSSGHSTALYSSFLLLVLVPWHCFRPSNEIGLGLRKSSEELIVSVVQRFVQKQYVFKQNQGKRVLVGICLCKRWLVQKQQNSQKKKLFHTKVATNSKYKQMRWGVKKKGGHGRGKNKIKMNAAKKNKNKCKRQVNNPINHHSPNQIHTKRLDRSVKADKE
jgi:hypothetical protein